MSIEIMHKVICGLKRYDLGRASEGRRKFSASPEVLGFLGTGLLSNVEFLDKENKPLPYNFTQAQLREDCSYVVVDEFEYPA